jgi:primosomal protein N' (replication factor Y)
VEEEIKRNFPEAVPVRWDRDTTGGKDTHEQLLEQFINRQANILIGTQMVAKGLDLPLVTLVGVVSADTALNLPDYRSGERTFQLLTQVGGRAGRGLLGGQVILQTYSPEHYAIQTAAEHDYYTFYKKERSYRASMGYPPFTRLIRLLVRHENLDTVKEHALKLHEQISRLIRDRNLKETSLIGPAPCFYPRLEGQYRWHVILRGPAPHMLIGAIKPVKWLQVDVDPVSLL